MCYGWKLIDGKWYYFGERQYVDRNWTPDAKGYWTAGATGNHSYGSLYMNEYTPDGYYVGSDGAWLVNGRPSSDDSSYTPSIPPMPPTPPTPVTYYTVAFDMQGHGTQVPGQTVESGKKVTKPQNPTADGYSFDGWYKEASCSNAWNFENDTVSEDTILYAKWTVKSFVVTFMTSDVWDTITETYGEKYVLPEEDPTREGYEFAGWFTKAEGGERITTGTIVDASVRKAYAHWTAKKYTVSFAIVGEEGGITPYTTCQVEFDKKIEDIPATPSKVPDIGYVFYGWYTDASCSNAWYFDTDVVKGDMTLYGQWTDACLAGGTMITMADGTKKPVETLAFGDMIKAFDHTTGKLTDARIIDFWHYKEPKYGLMTLHFTNDIDIRIVTAHSFFCIEDNTYVCIDKNNADEYIGKHFYNAETGGSEELLSVSSSDEKVETFFLATEEHFNCVAEGLLNVEDGLFVVISKIFDYDENMMIDQDKLAEDIRNYGLFTYEDFPYMTEEEFAYGKFAYLKIAIGKGIISEKFLQLFELEYSSDEYSTDV